MFRSWNFSRGRTEEDYVIYFLVTWMAKNAIGIS